jgi:hypothetical protein
MPLEVSCLLTVQRPHHNFGPELALLFMLLYAG